MKKFVTAVFALALSVGGFAGSASAVPAGLTDTGIIAPVNGNPTPFGPLTVTHIAGTAIGLSVAMAEPVHYIGRLYDQGFILNPLHTDLGGAVLSGTGLSGKSGTWNFTSGTSIYEIVALEINASVFIGLSHLYLTNPIANSGAWDTADFSSFWGQPDLNFLDFYGVYVGEAGTAVPEPLSLVLLGSGLVALRLVRRKTR